jgi:hypothetical protein
MRINPALKYLAMLSGQMMDSSGTQLTFFQLLLLNGATTIRLVTLALTTLSLIVLRI